MTALVALALIGAPLRLQAEWTAPNELPISRVHAIARFGGEYFVGGLRGLCRGKPGSWKQVDDRPVKDMLADGQVLWVLFGDGSVDKLIPKQDRLYYDILHGAVKRPWASCMALASQPTIYGGNSKSHTPKSANRNPKSPGAQFVIFGGQGGWIQKTVEGLADSYPKPLQGQIVTTILQFGGGFWVGTQKNGLFVLRNEKWLRFGFAAGLSDLWITSMTCTGGKLFVGVADGGVSVLSSGRFDALNCPVKKVRKFALYSGRLAVGGMDGAWIQDGKGWQRLSTEETTALASIGNQLLVGTPERVLWWK